MIASGKESLAGGSGCGRGGRQDSDGASVPGPRPAPTSAKPDRASVVTLQVTYARESDSGWIPVAEGYARAREAVERALSLDPELAEAHASLGHYLLFYEWDCPQAEESFLRALELNPKTVSSRPRSCPQ